MLVKDKNPVSPRKGHFLFIFGCLPLFLLSLFWPPPFSISLSLSLSCSILSFFLLVFLFCFLSVPSFSLFLSFSFFFAFVSLKEQHQNIKLQFFPEIFSVFWFPVLLFFPIPFSYLCFFLILSYVFCSTSMFLASKNKVEKHQFLVKRGVVTKRFFFMNLCFAKCEKLSFFSAHFFAQFWLMFKKNIVK